MEIVTNKLWGIPNKDELFYLHILIFGLVIELKNILAPTFSRSCFFCIASILYD